MMSESDIKKELLHGSKILLSRECDALSSSTITRIAITQATLTYVLFTARNKDKEYEI